MDYKQLYLEYLNQNLSQKQTIYWLDTETFKSFLLDIKFTYERNTTKNINTIIKKLFQQYSNERKFYYYEFSLRQRRY